MAIPKSVALAIFTALLSDPDSLSALRKLVTAEVASAMKLQQMDRLRELFKLEDYLADADVAMKPEAV